MKVKLAKKEDFTFPPLSYKGSEKLFLFGQILATSMEEAMSKQKKIWEKYNLYVSISKGIEVNEIPNKVNII